LEYFRKLVNHDYLICWWAVHKQHCSLPPLVCATAQGKGMYQQTRSGRTYFIAHGLLDQTRWTVPTMRIGAGEIWKAGNVCILNLHISKKIFGITVREWNDVFVALMESETCLQMIYWQARIISLENQLYRMFNLKVDR